MHWLIETDDAKVDVAVLVKFQELYNDERRRRKYRQLAILQQKKQRTVNSQKVDWDDAQNRKVNADDDGSALL